MLKCEDKLGDKLIGIGCLAHVLHNSAKAGCKKIGLDIETILYKLPHYFSEQQTRASAYAELCDELGRHCQLPEQYVQTRWLSMSKTISSIVPAFDIHQIYFDRMKKPSADEKRFKAFFSNKHVYPWLVVLKEIAEKFEAIIEQIEGDEVALVDAVKRFKEMQRTVQGQSMKGNLPVIVAKRIQKWLKKERDAFTKSVSDMYETVGDYMESWTRWTVPLEKFQWAALDKPMSILEVKSALQYFNDNEIANEISEPKLIDETVKVERFVRDNCESWNKQNLPTSERWAKVFAELPGLEHTEQLVAFAMALPGTNATCERLFSQLKYFWTEWKGRMLIESMEAIMKVRFNWTRDSDTVFETLIGDEELRMRVRDSEKYAKAAKNEEEMTDDNDEEYWNIACDTPEVAIVEMQPKQPNKRKAPTYSEVEKAKIARIISGLDSKMNVQKSDPK